MGSSEMVFSTARFLAHVDFDISQRQFGLEHSRCAERPMAMVSLPGCLFVFQFTIGYEMIKARGAHEMSVDTLKHRR